MGSANALGRADLGRLAPGAKADMVCVDLSGFHVGPVIDPIRSLVAFCTGRDVARVYVDGKVIVDEGKVLNADEEALRRAAHDIQNTLYEVAAQRDPLGRTVESILQLEKTT